MLFIKLMTLLIIANGAPILARRLAGNRLALPIDFSRQWFDRRALFGKTKTWRGLASALLVTPIASQFIFSSWLPGLLVAIGAMSGDLISSFIKRRLNIKPSDQAMFLDQLPEALLPLILVSYQITLTWQEILLISLVFVAIELLLSRLLFRLHIRDRPY